jgi:5,10-methylenetetrahydromethanopterin reductase
MWPDRPVRELVESARIAEANGFDEIWWPDHYFVRDIAVIMTALAMRTERLRIGAGVCSFLIRHPAVLASMFATLAELSGDRVVIGLGVGGSDVSQQLHLGTEKPLRATREAVSLVRSLVSGSVVDNDMSPSFPVSGAQLSFHGGEPIPIYLAVRGLKMARLAGELADGLITHGLSGDYLGQLTAAVHAGNEASQRSGPGCEIAVMLGVFVDEDLGHARDVLRPTCRTLVGGSYDADLIPAYGLDSDRVLALKAAVSAGDPDVTRLIEDDMVDAFTVGGPATLVIERLAALADSGVDRVILGWAGEITRDAIEGLARIRSELE